MIYIASLTVIARGSWVGQFKWAFQLYVGCTSKDLLNSSLLPKPMPNGLTLSIKPHSMLFQGTKIFPPLSPPLLKLQAKTDQPQKGPNEITLNFLFLKSGLILWGSGSGFLRFPEFESQKFLRSIKISVFSFLTFSYFEPLIFLKYCTKNTFLDKNT